MSILCAPAHYRLDGGQGGSEPLWAHEIIREVASRVAHVTAVTGYVVAPNLPGNVRVVTVGLRPDENFLDVPIKMRFFFQYGIAAMREFRRQRPDVFHHVLPFGLGETFNPVVPFIGDTPLVVGPVQGAPYRTHYEQLAVGGMKTKQGASTERPLAHRLVDAFSGVLGKLNLALLKRADAVIAITDEAADEIPSEIDRKKIVVIPPGVDTRRFHVRPRHASERLELLSVGYLVKRKRFDTALLALRDLVLRGRNVRLTIAGDGPERESLRAMAGDLGVAEHVRWLGFVSNSVMGEVYRDADVLVSGSEYESYGMMYLEALSSGLPFVAVENSGSRSFVKWGAPALLVPREDYAAMSLAIERLAPDRAAIEQLCGVARAFTEASFDWSAIGLRYLEAYRAATERRRSV